MRGGKCQYINCQRRQLEYPEARVFGFPVTDEERLEKWITNSGNDSLRELTHFQLRNRHVCAKHFKLSDYVDIRVKHRLLKRAIPIHYSLDESAPCTSKTTGTVQTVVPVDVGNELELKCWVDDLSPVQIARNWYTNNKIKEIREKIDVLANDPKSSVIYKGEFTSVHEVTSVVQEIVKVNIIKKENPKTKQEIKKNQRERVKLLRENEEFRKTERGKNAQRHRENRENFEYRQEELRKETQRRRLARENSEVRKNEQARDTQRRRVARQNSKIRQAEQNRDSERRRLLREKPEYRQAERNRETQRRRLARENPELRQKEQSRIIQRRRLASQISEMRRIEQDRDYERRRLARENFEESQNQNEESGTSQRRRLVCQILKVEKQI